MASQKNLFVMYLMREVAVAHKKKKQTAPGGFNIIDGIENNSLNNCMESYVTKSVQNILKDVPHLCNHLW